MTTAPPRSPKPSLTPAERRRRKARRAWIPTIIIGFIIVVAVAAAVLFQASGIEKVPQVSGNSKFNIAGLRVINGAADVQIDVRKPLSAASVGLPANSTRTFGPYDTIALEVDLIGTSGMEKLFVDSMRVVTQHGQVTTISTTTSDSGFLFIRTQLDSLSVLGFTPKQMAEFENAMPNGAGDANSHFSLPYGTGNSLGVPTAVSVACDGPKGCTITTRTTLRAK